MTTAPAGPSLAADTFGWDTAFAIPVQNTNAAIVRAGSSPPGFSGTGTDPLSGATYTVSGTFGPWQVALGGSGALINFAIPISTLTLKTSVRQVSFTGGEVGIQIRLHYLPQAAAAGPAQGTLHDLKVKGTTADKIDDPVATILALQFPDPKFNAISGAITPVLAEWFNDHLVDFDHVFATVNLNRTADKGQFAWLLPTATSYAFISPATNPTPANSYLGILNMTQGRSATGLNQELSPNIVPAGSIAGFLISSERLLSDLLLPNLPTVFPGCQTADFTLANDRLSLSLSQPVKLTPVTPTGASNPSNQSYSPHLLTLTIALLDQTIQFTAETRVDVNSYTQAFKSIQATYSIVLCTLPNGQQSLQFNCLGKTDNSWTVTSPGAVIEQIVLDVIIALGTILLAVVTDGAGLVVGMVVLGLLGTMVNITPELVATLGTNDAPSLSLLAFNATDTIIWADQKDFPLTFAGLNESLQLGGTPDFS